MKAPVELRSKWSCLSIMGMEAAIQLSIRLKVEQAGEARGNLLIYTSEMEFMLHMLRFCC